MSKSSLVLLVCALVAFLALGALAELESQAKQEADQALHEAEASEQEADAFLEAKAEEGSDADADADADAEDEVFLEIEIEADGEGEQEQAAEGEQAVVAEGEQAAAAEGEQAVAAEGEQAVAAEGEQAAAGEQAAVAEQGQAAAAEIEAAPAAVEQPQQPTYVLPYPPILPGQYTPMFNPYTNVNPLATPFAKHAAEPGTHPSVAAAAASQAGHLAAINGQIAQGKFVNGKLAPAALYAHGGYPYLPHTARHPVIAEQLQGNPVPFSGYAGWIHPQNMNSAAVGENAGAASLGQFIEVATAETEHGECVGCSY